MQYRLIGAGFVGSVCDLIFPHVVDQHWPQHSGHRPCCQQASVDGTYLIRAKQIPQVGRDGREASAVHAEKNHGYGDEQEHAVQMIRTSLWQKK